MASARGFVILVGVSLLVLLAREQGVRVEASMIYSGLKLPFPIHRVFYQAVGERKIGPNLYEVSTIIQEDILLKKKCECIPRHRCRLPSNIFYLSNRDCHHREKVCCELLENVHDFSNDTAIESDNEI